MVSEGIDDTGAEPNALVEPYLMITKLFSDLTFINNVVLPIERNRLDTPLDAPHDFESIGSKITHALQMRGGKVVEFPTTRLVLVDREKAALLQEQISAITKADWLVFTSANAVRALSHFSLTINPAEVHVAVVGDATRKIAEGSGFKVEIVAPEQDGWSLGVAMLEHFKLRPNELSCTARIVFVHGEVTSSGLERALLPLKNRLLDLVLYQSEIAEPLGALVAQVKSLLLEDLKSNPPDQAGWRTVYQIFTSALSIKNYVSLIGDEEETMRAVRMIPSIVIGRNTAAFARNLNLNVVVIPEEASQAKLIEMLETFVFHERALYSNRQ